jgi:tripartite-type tricarboxylate transporter receptor subunit TctC
MPNQQELSIRRIIIALRSRVEKVFKTPPVQELEFIGITGNHGQFRRKLVTLRQPEAAEEIEKYTNHVGLCWFRLALEHLVGLIIYNIDFDLEEDFAPIGLVSVNPQLLIARKTFPADDLKALVDWMKAHPGDAKFVNQNASGQVGAILLQKLTGTQVLLVPHRGAGPAMTDLISGQVDLAVFQAAVSLPQVKAGTLKALANLSPRRSQAIPDIPTSDEAGVPGFYMSGWFGLFAPKNTPADVIGKINSAMVQALADPAVRSRLNDLGLDVAPREEQTPEGLAAFQKAEIEKWWPIIKAAGIRGE